MNNSVYEIFNIVGTEWNSINSKDYKYFLFKENVA